MERQGKRFLKPGSLTGTLPHQLPPNQLCRIQDSDSWRAAHMKELLQAHLLKLMIVK